MPIQMHTISLTNGMIIILLYRVAGCALSIYHKQRRGLVGIMTEVVALFVAVQEPGRLYDAGWILVWGGRCQSPFLQCRTASDQSATPSSRQHQLSPSHNLQSRNILVATTDNANKLYNYMTAFLSSAKLLHGFNIK
jgi:hypothetical protein